jgi:hypothetical protein
MRTGGGEGVRSLTLSRVSITRARSLSGGGEGDRLSRSIILVVLTLSGGGLGDLSIILSRVSRTTLTGDGDLGRRSRGRVVNTSVSRSLTTNDPGSGLP